MIVYCRQAWEVIQVSDPIQLTPYREVALKRVLNCCEEWSGWWPKILQAKYTSWPAVDSALRLTSSLYSLKAVGYEERKGKMARMAKTNGHEQLLGTSMPWTPVGFASSIHSDSEPWAVKNARPCALKMSKTAKKLKLVGSTHLPSFFRCQ
jgi:hypothetical protein